METKLASSSDASESTSPDNDSVALLLIKMTTDENSRTYMEFANEKDAIKGFMYLFEELLKKKYSVAKVLAYTVSDIFDFIDLIVDLSIFTYAIHLDLIHLH